MTSAIGILINDFESLVPSQATAMFVTELRRRGHTPWVFGVADLGLDEGGHVIARARTPLVKSRSTSATLTQLGGAKASTIKVDELDGVLVRTNPGRYALPAQHAAALQLLRFSRERGVVVLNDPDGLTMAASKVYLGLLPIETRPRTIATNDAATLHRFVRDGSGRAVLKPAVGTRGRGVYRLDPSDPNLDEIVSSLLERGTVVAQEYVPAAEHGDTRVILVDGDALRVDGAYAAVQRVPKGGDFRSNIAAGGSAHPAIVTPGMEAVIAKIGPILRRHGLFLVGLDFIGDVVCEINVYSTGGFGDAEKFTGKPMTRAFVTRLLERLSEPTHARA